MALVQILQISTSSLTLIGIMFMVYKHFKDPDVQNKSSLEKMQISCKYRHEAIDKDVADINKNLTFLKENHINHMEDDIKGIKESQIKILTLLGAKYQLKEKDL